MRVTVRRRATGQAGRGRLLLLVASVALWPALAGCSSYSLPWSSSSNSNYQPAPPQPGAAAQSAYNQPTYNMAQAQAPAYGTAAVQPASAAAPQPPHRNTAIGYGDPAPAYSPPPTTAAASSYAAPPASSANQVDTGAGVYPSQSLADLFKGSTTDSSSSRPGNVVHPPNAYTPVGSSGTASQPAPAADAAAGSAGVYPQQSLSDILSGK
jgi:hypothetical protein